MSPDNQTQFAKLWTRAQPNVLAYISASIRGFQDAEDVLQNVAVVAIRKFSNYDHGRPFVPWILGIAKYEVLHFLRSRSKDPHEWVDDELLTLLAGAYERRFEILDQERAALADCLPNLRGKMRDAVEQRHGEGIKPAVIAESMGTSPGYVSILLNRAYKQLRKCISQRIAMEGRA